MAICDAVDLSMADLFATPQTTLVRKSARPSLRGLPKAADVIDTLITPKQERHVTVLETAVAPGGSGGSERYTLPSECEVCFVLEGRVEIDVQGEIFELEAGDALTFGAAVPHTWRNVGPRARACSGSSRPVFPTRERSSSDLALRTRGRARRAAVHGHPHVRALSPRLGHVRGRRSGRAGHPVRHRDVHAAGARGSARPGSATRRCCSARGIP